MREIKTALNGLGRVNKNLLRILADKRERLAQDYDLSFKIVAVADSSGIATNGDGFDGIELCAHKDNGHRVSDLPNSHGGKFNLAELDLIFEGSPVDLETGGTALTLAEDALSHGISVVLANKGPIVHACNKLRQLSVDNHCGLGYSATVCGGLPIINIGERDMNASYISMLCGVFNGTSNFIFDALKNRVSFSEALKEAQNAGAAEADPSLDTGGWDAAFKLLIIANSFMGVDITLDDIEVEGIENIAADRLIAEDEVGHTIKLLASAVDGKYTVKPTVLPKQSFLGSIDGWEMGVEIHSDIYGITYHKIYEREPIPTAASMMRDAVNIFYQKM